MSQKRSLTGLLVASLGLAAGLAVFSTAPVSAADDCSAIKQPAVQATCTKGGKSAVKSAMKKAVEDINAAKIKPEKGGGAKFECKTCHADSMKFALNADGAKLFDDQLSTYFNK